MKKWIFISSLAIIIILGFFINVYLNAVKPVKAAEEKAVKIAKEKTNLKSVRGFSLYNGLEPYDVIWGENSKGEKIIVWISEKDKKVTVKKEKDGISKQDAIKKLKEEKNPKKILDVRLGMLKNRPAWEIYYLSENDLINYYYVDFETGEWLTKIENL
ncbi:peptidase propeptide and ypeb domain protein [Bacillus methanolicus MGA3]|uniref:Peptidase propeptide and ypeb domain protein n=1 Tax=Bacillus methanolicus (strain MGA3 / ATCC 53907) TaxID=796606 RepID=I3E9U8_BACMM|nr:DUF5590 domain-containing protein [Bacillus methanolicus]AIE60515.1 peptidase propeptide and ypeb domain protein [Bacillus methanolicus MGA3]EIJ83269.1 peptidase propeptide and ypeb domain protein [Bacillus methanolicus MGA3]UQD52526.1 peptidase [Bacillus methanolicus]